MLIRTLLLCLTAMFVVVGWYQLDRFSSTPGNQGVAPGWWPHDLPASFAPEMAKAGARRGSETATLLVFLHPRCSCSHATLEQLQQILDSTRGPLQVFFLVYRSKVVDDAAGSSALQGFAPDAARHREVRIVSDWNGALARRFGAATSGEIVLYGAEGRLLFQGGITPARAHLGDSDGADRLRNALATGIAQATTSNVFGCAIFQPRSAPVQRLAE